MTILNDIEDICIVTHCKVARTGRFERQRERGWKHLKCGATEED